MKLEGNNHSVFLMYYHLVLVTKYRRNVIGDSVSDRLRVIFEYMLLTITNAYKSASSRLIKKENPQIKERLWKEYFWSRSFCLLTTGGAPIEVIRQYIESQGEKL